MLINIKLYFYLFKNTDFNTKLYLLFFLIFATYLITSLNYIDIYRHLYSESKDIYTWWDQRTKMRVQNKGRRIDFFLIRNQYLKLIKNFFSEIKFFDI